MADTHELPPDIVFQKAEGYHVVEADDGFVIEDPISEHVHFVNTTAAVVYEMCDGETSFQNIVGLVDGAYSLAGSSRNEVAACLAALEGKGLIQRVPPRSFGT